VYAGEINADKITTGSLKADIISSTSLNATNITAGTLDADKITVKNLSATKISSGTLTGSTVQTANSGLRVRMNSSNNSFEVLNSSNEVTGTFSSTMTNGKGVRISSDTVSIVSGTNIIFMFLGGGSSIQFSAGGTTFFSVPSVAFTSLGQNTSATTYNVVHSRNATGFDQGKLNRIQLSGTGIRNVNVGASGLLTISASDERLKENIEPLTLGLNIIEKLEPKKFEFKENPGTMEYGLIAQEVREILNTLGITDNTNLVFEDESEENLAKLPEGETGPVLGVEYMKLIPILINSVKELQARVELLEKDPK
jgi:hypothetical protein